jgi:hypothetical protein
VAWAAPALAPLIIVAAIPIILVSPDSILDLAFMANDLRNGDYASFYLNAVGLMIPGVTGLGIMLSKADEAYDALRFVNNADNLRESNNLIQLYGFEGTLRTADHYIDSNPLIYAGHVGVSFNNGKTIFGFSPFAPDMTNREIINALKNRISFPGQVLDDTAIFHLAQDLADQGYRTQVYVKSISVSEDIFLKIKQNVFDDLFNSPLQHKKYSFPGVSGCYNCATWPVTNGIPIPEDTGKISYYVPALIQSGGIPWVR